VIIDKPLIKKLKIYSFKMDGRRGGFFSRLHHIGLIFNAWFPEGAEDFDVGPDHGRLPAAMPFVSIRLRLARGWLSRYNQKIWNRAP
jgi:hypothetical protein